MLKDADINLTCRQCGKEFVLTKAEHEFYELKGFSLPSRCKKCRSTRQNQPQHLICSQCGTELEKGTPLYCTACLEGANLELEQKTKQIKMAASATRTKLEASESQKAELAESLRQKEQLITELEEKVNRLSEDLDKAQQFYAAAGWLQPFLNGIEERLKDLEYTQHEINQKMLRTIRIMQEKYENISLLEMIKRNLRQSLKEGA
ncbi:MAG: zinc-ribbon domain containing protein [Dehalococcoidales bacterium]